MTSAFPKDEFLATIRCEASAMLPCKLDWPIHRIRYFGGHPGDARRNGASQWTDLWGTVWRKESPDPAMMPFPIGHPLDADFERLDTHPWPDPDDPHRFADLLHHRPPEDELLVGEHPFALFERAWLLTGMEPLLEAMADCPGRVDALFARIGAFEEAVACRYIDLGVEAAWISDDYGMNAALMFSPQMWRRFVRPHLQRIVNRYHEAGAVVFLHSCGNITPLIDGFLEIGVDVLDPLQPGCNALGLIRARTAGRLCLSGGIEASTLLSGDVTRTALETSRRIDELGRAGGYIVGPDDEWDFPLSTYSAMLNTVQQYRDRRCL